MALNMLGLTRTCCRTSITAPPKLPAGLVYTRKQMQAHLEPKLIAPHLTLQQYATSKYLLNKSRSNVQIGPMGFGRNTHIKTNEQPEFKQLDALERQEIENEADQQIVSFKDTDIGDQLRYLAPYDDDEDRSGEGKEIGEEGVYDEDDELFGIDE